jgi:hypothetical protein
VADILQDYILPEIFAFHSASLFASPFDFSAQSNTIFGIFPAQWFSADTNPQLRNPASKHTSFENVADIFHQQSSIIKRSRLLHVQACFSLISLIAHRVVYCTQIPVSFE